MKNPTSDIYDLIIIGSGPGGMTSAIYASRAGLKTLVIEKEAPGGKMIKTADIENYPGFKTIKGPDISMKLYTQATDLGAEYAFCEVESVKHDDKSRIIELISKANFKGEIQAFKTKALIIATGMKENPLGVPGEEKLYGRGVSYCAVCDGAFYKDKEIFVVGGGYSAIEEGAYLTRFGKHVNLVHRRQEFRADSKQVDKFKAHENVNFILDSVVQEIIGESKVEALVIKNLKNGEIKTMKADAIFPYVGSTPITDFLKPNLSQILDEQGFIKVNSMMQTDVKGIYAIGDVRTTPLRQIATALGDGAIAAQMVAEYLQHWDD